MKTTATAITNHFEMLSRSWTASSDGVAARFAGAAFAPAAVAATAGTAAAAAASASSASSASSSACPRSLPLVLEVAPGLLGRHVFAFGLGDLLVDVRLRRRARSRRAPARRACPAVDRSSGDGLLHARAARRRHGAGASTEAPTGSWSGVAEGRHKKPSQPRADRQQPEERQDDLHRDQLGEQARPAHRQRRRPATSARKLTTRPSMLLGVRSWKSVWLGITNTMFATPMPNISPTAPAAPRRTRAGARTGPSRRTRR